MEWHLTLEDETHSDVEMGPARPIHPMRPNIFQGGMGHGGPVPPYIIPGLVAIPFEDRKHIHTCHAYVSFLGLWYTLY
jgi:hypothetical protein